MRTDLFDFDLPEDRIALTPASPRDAARLLVVSPSRGEESPSPRLRGEGRGEGQPGAPTSRGQDPGQRREGSHPEGVVLAAAPHPNLLPMPGEGMGRGDSGGAGGVDEPNLDDR